MFMRKPWDVLGDNMMKTAGDKARRGVDNFMKAFEKDYEIEHIVADLEARGKGEILKLPQPQLKVALQIKMKKRMKKNK